jgi:hypothetical protein
MADADASEAARTLAQARWGDQRVRAAVALLVERRDELTEPLLADLRSVTDPDVPGPGADRTSNAARLVPADPEE